MMSSTKTPEPPSTGGSVSSQAYGQTPAERGILALASRMRREGYSWSRIASHLNDLGYQNRKGHRFSQTGLRAVLKGLQPTTGERLRCLSCKAERPGAAHAGRCPPCIRERKASNIREARRLRRGPQADTGICTDCPNAFDFIPRGRARRLCDECRQRHSRQRNIDSRRDYPETQKCEACPAVFPLNRMGLTRRRCDECNRIRKNATARIKHAHTRRRQQHDATAERAEAERAMCILIRPLRSEGWTWALVAEHLEEQGYRRSTGAIIGPRELSKWYTKYKAASRLL